MSYGPMSTHVTPNNYYHAGNHYKFHHVHPQQSPSIRYAQSCTYSFHTLSGQTQALGANAWQAALTSLQSSPVGVVSRYSQIGKDPMYDQYMQVCAGIGPMIAQAFDAAFKEEEQAELRAKTKNVIADLQSGDPKLVAAAKEKAPELIKGLSGKEELGSASSMRSMAWA